MVLLWASVSRSVDDSLVITSLRMALIDFLFANHWRRILVSSLVASILSSMIARVDQRYEKARRFKSSRIPGVVVLGKPTIVRTRRLAEPNIGSSPPVSGWSANNASMYMGISGTRTRLRLVEIVE